MKLHYGDLTDSSSLVRLIDQIKPDEIYNLGAQSHVKVSFDLRSVIGNFYSRTYFTILDQLIMLKFFFYSEYTANVDALGTLRILDAIRTCKLEKKVKFYQASTSEMFGKVQEIPQNETTPFYPRSPYGVAKLYGYWIVINYREAYDLFAVNGILFNHER